MFYTEIKLKKSRIHKPMHNTSFLLRYTNRIYLHLERKSFQSLHVFDGRKSFLHFSFLPGCPVKQKTKRNLSICYPSFNLFNEKFRLNCKFVLCRELFQGKTFKHKYI